MKAVVQVAAEASVHIDKRPVAAIEEGLVVLLGVHRLDTDKNAAWLADKIVHLRIFPDEAGLMNRSLLEIGGEVLVVSQFTLLGDCRKGRRPSYSEAAPPERARQLYQVFIDLLREKGLRVATGEFQAMMDVSLVNRGPVTLLLDSARVS
jgi:D-tyrosyl-tRNA(Tyr) deacylase